MGIGDPPIPVASAVEANNPVPGTEKDDHRDVDQRVTKLERSATAELARQIEYLYDLLSEPYPPP